MNRFFFSLGNPNAQTTDGETPLHVAAIWNRELIIKMLLVSEKLGYCRIIIK